MNALIIDDSTAMRKIVGKIVTGLGFKTLEAADGQQGVEVMEQHADEIDLVLVDWNMPVMNGLEFVKHIRSCDQYRDHKLVMVTTETEPARMAQALMAGVDEFVMKPFTAEILIDKLRLIGIQFNETATP